MKEVPFWVIFVWSKGGPSAALRIKVGLRKEARYSYKLKEACQVEEPEFYSYKFSHHYFYVKIFQVWRDTNPWPPDEKKRRCGTGWDREGTASRHPKGLPGFKRSLFFYSNQLHADLNHVHPSDKPFNCLFNNPALLAQESFKNPTHLAVEKLPLV